jgi:hypothetical protein
MATVVDRSRTSLRLPGSRSVLGDRLAVGLADPKTHGPDRLFRPIPHPAGDPS